MRNICPISGSEALELELRLDERSQLGGQESGLQGRQESADTGTDSSDNGSLRRRHVMDARDERNEHGEERLPSSVGSALQEVRHGLPFRQL